jgi:hypothetical protein
MPSPPHCLEGRVGGHKRKGVTAMDNIAEPYDLLTVLMSLQGLEGMGSEIGRGRPLDDELGVPATEAGRIGLVRKTLTALLSPR